MKGLQLIATGGALPGRTVTNEDLSRMVDTSDEWITSRTGIRTRHWCTDEESAATLAVRAAKQALERSGLAPADIACCICATLSAPDATPSVACQVQAALGLPEDRPALDVNAACSGFLYGMGVARGLLATLGGQYALVIGCEALSRLMDPACPVQLVFVPSYLNGDDGIFNKHYYELLCGMDVTVFPSYYEPWGYTPLESIAFSVGRRQTERTQGRRRDRAQRYERFGSSCGHLGRAEKLLRDGSAAIRFVPGVGP